MYKLSNFFKKTKAYTFFNLTRKISFLSLNAKRYFSKTPLSIKINPIKKRDLHYFNQKRHIVGVNNIYRGSPEKYMQAAPAAKFLLVFLFLSAIIEGYRKATATKEHSE